MIAGNEKRHEEYSEVVRRRTKEIQDIEAELTKAIEDTRMQTGKLREQSENVLQLRLRFATRFATTSAANTHS